MTNRSINKAVTKAYDDGNYIDNDGNKWRRGMDGWFLDDIDGKGGVMMARHDDMVELIVKENP